MWRRPDFRRISRGLRFRLTASYALIFACLFMLFATLLRERLKTILADQTQGLLDQRWGTLKASLDIDRVGTSGAEKVYWHDPGDDPDELRSIQEIKSVFAITDSAGNVLDDIVGATPDGSAISNTYTDLGKDSDIPKLVAAAVATRKPNPPPVWRTRRNSDGEQFLIRLGVFYSTRKLPNMVALGTSLEPNNRILHDFTWVYAAVIPGALVLGSLMGWIMAGRALTPVLGVARTAQRITGSNLSLRIPSQRSGDELDFLILTFNRMIERLEASFQQIKQFSTDVSHELRTPITAIRGQLEVALFTAKTTEQYREAMFNALTDVDRLSQIVRALLLLSQAESGQLALQKTRLNVCELVTDLVDQFQIPAEAAGVHLTVDTSEECFALADPVQIERLISNLLSNALKFTPEKGAVRVRVRPAEDRTLLIVEDSGRGIPTEHLPHIFDRFYRVPGSGTAPSPEQGLGLGLSFVAWIVKAHEGEINVESTPGKGTKFTISLPAAGAVETPDAASQSVTPA